jgi:hypothetical protein
MGLLPTISLSYIVSQDLSENALGQPCSSMYNCWNRTTDKWRARRVARSHGTPYPGHQAATHAPARIPVGFKSVGPTLPQKASPLGWHPQPYKSCFSTQDTQCGTIPYNLPSQIARRDLSEIHWANLAPIPIVGTGPPIHGMSGGPPAHTTRPPRPSSRDTRVRTHSSGL